MKLVVTIPAYNEEKTISKVIDEIPRRIKGVKSVEVLVIDDGSTDKTYEQAKKADKTIRHKRNLGLARSFKDGIDTALKMNADIIVNTDADGQYDGEEIKDLIKPILNGKADVVLGSRFKGKIEYMPPQKVFGNKLATAVTRLVSGYPVSDAQTGFRAFTREAALKLNIQADYTYVQETIIQAHYKGLKIVEVPVTFRKRDGKSRLVSNIFNYAGRSGMTILRNYLAYKPLRAFGYIGSIILIISFLFMLRVLFHFLKTGMVDPLMPSVVLAGILAIVGFLIIILGLIADTIRANREIQEEILYNLKRQRR